jgi:DNA-binding response OmpR family regulator
MREKIAAGVPDLVLRDLGLPGEDGLSLARWLRANHACGIVMVTGSADTVDRIVGLEVGADDYIGKPSSRANCWRASRACCGGCSRRRRRVRPRGGSGWAAANSTSPPAGSSTATAATCR